MWVCAGLSLCLQCLGSKYLYKSSNLNSPAFAEFAVPKNLSICRANGCDDGVLRTSLRSLTALRSPRRLNPTFHARRRRDFFTHGCRVRPPAEMATAQDKEMLTNGWFWQMSLPWDWTWYGMTMIQASGWKMMEISVGLDEISSLLVSSTHIYWCWNWPVLCAKSYAR